MCNKIKLIDEFIVASGSDVESSRCVDVQQKDLGKEDQIICGGG